MNEGLYDRIHAIVRCIPVGRVTTYGAIAQCIGARSGARLVGYALQSTLRSPLTPAVPAHRVVNRLGHLSGRAYFPGDSMRECLVQEGVGFLEDYTVDLVAHFWDPGEHFAQNRPFLDPMEHA